MLALITVAIVSVIAAGPVSAVRAAEYPSWDDVAAARSEEVATKQQISKIEIFLAVLQAEAARAVAESDAKAAIWEAADTRYQQSVFKAEKLRAQADEANAVAAISGQRAGTMAAQLARGGSGDITLKLLLESDGSAKLLYSLGMTGKIAEQANSVYEKALNEQNTAQALTDQADVAKTKLDELRNIAEEVFAAAQQAAAAAGAALEEQRANEATLKQQLTVLTERRSATEADYLAGVQERIDSAASLDAGEISLSGWARPSSGYITSVYGWSEQYGTRFHKGVDLGFACGTNVYAANGGTVIFAAEGWNGGYGNYIIIDHGNGVKTAYAHLIEGGVLVSTGDRVSVGQNIARGGTTGSSTGCHLHFEVRVGGQTVDPASFMTGQGIRIG